MAYFKTYSENDALVVEYNNTSGIHISQDTILQVNNCAIECIYTPKELPIYGRDAVFIEFSSEPDEQMLEHLKDRYGKRPLLSNISGPDKRVIDIYNTRYYYFSL